jgi:hypothetical protein
MQSDNENIKYNEKDNILFLSSVYRDKKQLTVNKKDSRLNKNRIAAKNEKIQDNICSQIDGFNDAGLKLAYRSRKRDERKAERRAK